MYIYIHLRGGATQVGVVPRGGNKFLNESTRQNDDYGDDFIEKNVGDV